MSQYYKNGFTLIELLIALLVISVGLLGVARLAVETQKQSQQISQRTIALELANNLMARVSANPTALAQYDDPIPANQPKDCTTNACSTSELAQHDLWQWNQALQGATITRAENNAVIRINTGGLVLPTACRVINNNTVTITLVWRGKHVMPNRQNNNCALNDANYRQSANNDLRRLLSIATLIRA
ncbi:type IV pilus modification protein PilV [Endozoicomonas sp. (ex Bugula neritina AB1)]|nr:type IV pilus modification protein PilV [Endozoicomonas sp. (ex Bugula neritina AB1)]